MNNYHRVMAERECPAGPCDVFRDILLVKTRILNHTQSYSLIKHQSLKWMYVTLFCPLYSPALRMLTLFLSSICPGCCDDTLGIGNRHQATYIYIYIHLYLPLCLSLSRSFSLPLAIYIYVYIYTYIYTYIY